MPPDLKQEDKQFSSSSVGEELMSIFHDIYSSKFFNWLISLSTKNYELVDVVNNYHN